MSESSSGEEFEDICPSDPPVPKWPLPPSCAYDTELYAFWDLLVRPHGVSVRRLERLFREKHGAPSSGWLSVLHRSHYFEFFYAIVSHGKSPLLAARSSTLRVRRLRPEHLDAGEGVASARLQRARSDFRQWAVDKAADRSRAELQYAGAATVPRVSREQRQLAPFSHRLMEKRSDAEALFTPFPTTITCPRVRSMTWSLRRIGRMWKRRS